MIPTANPRRLLADDCGSTLILTIFYTALSLVLILLVTAATSLYLERKRLFALADGAALVGAEAFELSDVTATSGAPSVLLDDDAVASAVTDYVAVIPHDFEGLAIDRAASPDGAGAVVELSAMWRPPVVSLLVPEGLRIEVQASARSVFG
jgi:hypothetical protein